MGVEGLAVAIHADEPQEPTINVDKSWPVDDPRDGVLEGRVRPPLRPVDDLQDVGAGVVIRRGAPTRAVAVVEVSWG